MLIGRRAILAALPALFITRAAFAQSAADIAKSLAPTGRLKAAINLGNAVLAQKDAKTGAVSGVIVDFTNELARRLNLPVDFIYYDTGGKLAPGQAIDHWDICYLGTDQGRSAGFDVTAPYLYLDATYLVRADAPYRKVADVDTDGVRITTAQGSAYDAELVRQLKHAMLVRAPNSPEAIALFEKGGAEAAAGIRQALMEAAKAAPGYRVLPDAYTRIDQAVTVPKGRDAGFAYVAALVEELKKSGFIRASLDRHGQSGASVAPS